MAKTETEHQTDAQNEKDRAKRENATNKIKQRHEDKLADYTSPEELRKDGGEIHPTQKVTPSQPDPQNDESLTGTRYSGDAQN